jgi:hypothetical protein
LVDFDEDGAPQWIVELADLDPRIFIQSIHPPIDEGWKLKTNGPLEAWLHGQQNLQPRNLASLSDLIAPLH